MKRDRECELQVARRQIIEALDKSARGQRDVPHTDILSIGVVHQFEKAHHVIKIIKRFANAHEDDIRDLAARLTLGVKHLIQHLRGLKAADQAADRGRAERAPLPAADLRGNADGVAVLVVHDDRLDGIAVAKLPEVLDRAVHGGDLLAQHFQL